ncbi:hypothetical protein DPMN_073487 [Dreissena polymorpha]|uniref:Uncharacterized protein n=1 Tax=Dreissena polymorpha TaxID=45954 RepID=A0A9D4BZ41_DREPO|nr:hypothetical protein DPMN_073487 [Dreissena polymorpha]
MHSAQYTCIGSSIGQYSDICSNGNGVFGFSRSLDRSKGGFENILVITDHFSRYAQAFPTPNQTARTTARVLFEYSSFTTDFRKGYIVIKEPILCPASFKKLVKLQAYSQFGLLLITQWAMVWSRGLTKP